MPDYLVRVKKFIVTKNHSIKKVNTYQIFKPEIIHETPIKKVSNKKTQHPKNTAKSYYSLCQEVSTKVPTIMTQANIAVCGNEVMLFSLLFKKYILYILVCNYIISQHNLLFITVITMRATFCLNLLYPVLSILLLIFLCSSPPLEKNIQIVWGIHKHLRIKYSGSHKKVKRQWNDNNKLTQNDAFDRNSRHARIIKQFKCQTVFEKSWEREKNISRERVEQWTGGSVRKSLIFMSKQYKKVKEKRTNAKSKPNCDKHEKNCC